MDRCCQLGADLRPGPAACPWPSSARTTASRPRLARARRPSARALPSRARRALGRSSSGRASVKLDGRRHERRTPTDRSMVWRNVKHELRNTSGAEAALRIAFTPLGRLDEFRPRPSVPHARASTTPATADEPARRGLDQPSSRMRYRDETVMARRRPRSSASPAGAARLTCASARACRPRSCTHRPEQAAEVREELLLLVRRVGRSHGLDQQRVELGGGDPVEHQLVDVRQRGRAELRVPLDLEVLVGQPAVLGQLLLVAQVLAVADLEVAARVEVHAARRGGR